MSEDRIVCPVHGMSDCSPLLNGCSRVNQLWAEREQQEAPRRTAMTLRFVAHGLPAPQGSKRHVGHGVMVESSKRVKPWREAVKEAALDAMPADWTMLDGPISAMCLFYFTRPDSHYGTGRNAAILKPSAPGYPMGKTTHGDVEKLARSTFDAISDAGVWRDDCLVVQAMLGKLYVPRGEPGHALITINDLTQELAW